MERIVSGVRFDCLKTLDGYPEWRSQDGRFSAWENPQKTGYHAAVEELPLWSENNDGTVAIFTTLEEAMVAAVAFSATTPSESP